MAEKVKLSKDGSSIDFVVTDVIPATLKKFRQSTEIEGFYRFIFENDLQKESFEILSQIIAVRKAAKKAIKTEEQQIKKDAIKEQKEAAKAAAKEIAQKEAVQLKKSADIKKAAESKKAKEVKVAAKAKPAKAPAAKAKAPVKKKKK